MLELVLNTVSLEKFISSEKLGKLAIFSLLDTVNLTIYHCSVHFSILGWGGS